MDFELMLNSLPKLTKRFYNYIKITLCIFNNWNVFRIIFCNIKNEQKYFYKSICLWIFLHISEEHHC